MFQFLKGFFLIFIVFISINESDQANTDPTRVASATINQMADAMKKVISPSCYEAFKTGALACYTKIATDWISTDAGKIAIEEGAKGETDQYINAVNALVCEKKNDALGCLAKIFQGDKCNKTDQDYYNKHIKEGMKPITDQTHCIIFLTMKVSKQADNTDISNESNNKMTEAMKKELSAGCYEEVVKGATVCTLNLTNDWMKSDANKRATEDEKSGKTDQYQKELIVFICHKKNHVLGCISKVFQGDKCTPQDRDYFNRHNEDKSNFTCASASLNISSVLSITVLLYVALQL